MRTNDNQAQKSKITIPQDINDTKKFQDYWSFYISEGCYWFTEQKGKKPNEIRISDFTMKILYHLDDGSNNTLRIVKIRNVNGKEYLKEIYSNEMTGEKLKTILRSASCTFKGNSFQLESIFEYLMQTEKNAKIINNLGYQKEFNIYAYADSIINSENKLLKINDLGIVEDNGKLYYLPAFSKANINNDNYSYERYFAYKQGDLDFSQWAKLVYETFGINGAIGINYTIASIFRDLIFDELKFFPFLFLFGQYGTGKTSFIESILHLFGSYTIGTPLSNVTVVGLSRETSQRTNSLFYYKEFTIDNSEIANPFILNAYDGSGRTTGTKSNDNKTKKFIPQSGIIFDGNYLPIQKDAVFSRLILLVFDENKFTEKQKNTFNILANHKEKGLSQIVKELLKYRTIFKEKFKQTYNETIKDIDTEPKLKDIPSRLKNHSALILTIYKILYQKIDFPYTFEELVRKTIEYMIEQYSMLEEIKDISNFWKAAEYFTNKGYLIENQDFLKEFLANDNEGYIFIKYDAFYTHYVKYCSENKLNKIDKLSLRKLLTSKTNKAFIPNTTQNSRKTLTVNKRPIGSSYQFYFEKIDNGIKINDLELNL